VVLQSSNGSRHINKVTLCRNRLVLGWVTIFSWANHLSMLPVTQANSASYPQWDGNEYRPKCGDALQLAVKTCTAHSIRGWTYGRQVKPSLTHAVPECLRDESIIKHYTTTTTTTTTTTITTTTTVLWPFVRDYPGEPVPEETLIHPPSWSSPNLYQLLPSTTIHSVLCSNWVLGNLFAQPPPTSSLVYLLVWSSPSHTPYISSPNQCLLFF